MMWSPCGRPEGFSHMGLERVLKARLAVGNPGGSPRKKSELNLTFITPQHHGILTRVITKRKNAHMLIESQGRNSCKALKRRSKLSARWRRMRPRQAKQCRGTALAGWLLSRRWRWC